MGDGDTCPRCNFARGTPYHRYWECPANCLIENQFPLKSSDKYEATTMASKESAQLTRGLVPKTSYPKIPLPPYHREGKQWTQGAFSANSQGIVVFTDGSGGKAGSDTRLRRCGWAFIQMKPGTTDLLASASGVLEGPVQTVARAELTAFAEALRGTACHICVVSDSAYVVNEFAKLQKVISPIEA